MNPILFRTRCLLFADYAVILASSGRHEYPNNPKPGGWLTSELIQKNMIPLKILHVIGQRPEMTGSGIYLEAIIRESQKHGFLNYWVAGVPVGRIHPLKDMPQVQGSFVFLNRNRLISLSLECRMLCHIKVRFSKS